MSCVLGVLSQYDTEVEAELDQVGNVTGFGFSVSCRCSHYIVDNAKEGGLRLLDRWVLDALGLKLPGEAPVHSGV